MLPYIVIKYSDFRSEIVFALTKSFRPTMEHAVLSHFLPFLVSVLLHVTYIRAQPFKRDWEIFSLYFASLIAIFWTDIKKADLWNNAQSHMEILSSTSKFVQTSSFLMADAQTDETHSVGSVGSPSTTSEGATSVSSLQFFRECARLWIFPH